MSTLDDDAKEIQRDLKLEAISARARGDSAAERTALDRLISFEQRAGLA